MEKVQSYNKYKRFFLKLLLLLVIIFVVDFLMGSLLERYYFKQESGLLYRTTYSMEKTTADILIFGSSRANHHYKPEVFENNMPGYTYYNVGRDGNFIFYHYAVLKSVLKRYAPKIVILDFGRHELIKDNESYDRIASLLPYYATHPEIRSIVQLKSTFERVKLLSHIYPYNSSLLTIAIGNVELNKTRRSDIKGYVPLTKTWNEPIETYNEAIVGKELDPQKIACYENFLKDCKDKGVKVYVFVSPYFQNSSYTDISIKRGAEIAAKYGVQFYDHSRDTVFTSQKLLFSDPLHLNDNGANVYSKMVVESILNNQ